jgi:hypothetical protein
MGWSKEGSSSSQPVSLSINTRFDSIRVWSNDGNHSRQPPARLVVGLPRRSPRPRSGSKSSELGVHGWSMCRSASALISAGVLPELPELPEPPNTTAGQRRRVESLRLPVLGDVILFLDSCIATRPSRPTTPHPLRPPSTILSKLPPNPLKPCLGRIPNDTITPPSTWLSRILNQAIEVHLRVGGRPRKGPK